MTAAMRNFPFSELSESELNVLDSHNSNFIQFLFSLLHSSEPDHANFARWRDCGCVFELRVSGEEQRKTFLALYKSRCQGVVSDQWESFKRQLNNFSFRQYRSPPAEEKWVAYCYMDDTEDRGFMRGRLDLLHGVKNVRNKKNRQKKAANNNNNNNTNNSNSNSNNNTNNSNSNTNMNIGNGGSNGRGGAKRGRDEGMGMGFGDDEPLDIDALNFDEADLLALGSPAISHHSHASDSHSNSNPSSSSSSSSSSSVSGSIVTTSSAAAVSPFSNATPSFHAEDSPAPSHGDPSDVQAVPSMGAYGNGGNGGSGNDYHNFDPQQQQQQQQQQRQGSSLGLSRFGTGMSDGNDEIHQLPKQLDADEFSFSAKRGAGNGGSSNKRAKIGVDAEPIGDIVDGFSFEEPYADGGGASPFNLGSYGFGSPGPGVEDPGGLGNDDHAAPMLNFDMSSILNIGGAEEEALGFDFDNRLTWRRGGSRGHSRISMIVLLVCVLSAVGLGIALEAAPDAVARIASGFGACEWVGRIDEDVMEACDAIRGASTPHSAMGTAAAAAAVAS